MRLNLQSDYALRLLMHLAINDDILVTISEIAARYDISKNHLMKVAHVLGRAGIIKTVRGRTGGVSLAKPSDQIIVGNVVRLMEADLFLVECFQDDAGQCLVSPSCRLKGILNTALEAFLDILDQYTVDQLVRRNPPLRRVLKIEAIS